MNRSDSSSEARPDDFIESLQNIYSFLHPPPDLPPSHPAVLEHEILRGIERLRRERDTFALRLNRLDALLNSLSPDLVAEVPEHLRSPASLAPYVGTSQLPAHAAQPLVADPTSYSFTRFPGTRL